MNTTNRIATVLPLEEQIKVLEERGAPPPNIWEPPEVLEERGAPPPDIWEPPEVLEERGAPPPDIWEPPEVLEERGAPPPDDWEPPEVLEERGAPPPDDWEPPNDWKPPEPPEPPKLLKVINPSAGLSKIPAESYVEMIAEEAFDDEKLYGYICRAKVNEFRRGQIIEAFAKRAHKLGGAKLEKQYRKQLKIYSTMLKEQSEKQGRNRVSGSIDGMTNYSDLPSSVSNLYCGNLWTATDEGVFFLGGKEPCMISRQPILIIGILKSEDTGEEKVKLLFKCDGIWRETICGKDIIASVQKIVSLSRMGISITSQNAKGMVAFLQAMEDCSRSKYMIPIIKTISKMGWNQDKTIFYPYTDEKVEYDDELGLPGLANGLEEKGSRSEWKKRFKAMRKIAMVQFMTAANLSAVIVGMLNLDGFTACLYGESRGGKSVASKIACSLWAGFEREDHYIYSANNTLNAMDDILGAYCNLPVILDDLNNMSEADQKRIPQALAMKVSNGVGKGRMSKNGKLRTVQQWRTTACITSEKSMTSNFHNAGSYNRVIQMEGTSRENCPFTKDGMNPGEIMNFFENNHGFGGKDFIYAMKEIENEKLIRRLHEIRQQVSEKAKEQGKAGGQELPVAVMLLADEIAEKYLFQDGVRFSVDDAVEWMSDENTVNQSERFYNTLMDYVVQNSGKFEGWRLTDLSATPYWGRYDEEKGEIAILPCVLKDLADEENVDVQMFLKYLDAKELLVKDKSGNYTRNVYSKMLKNGQRMYVIVMPDQNEIDHDSEETVEEYNQMEIPFPLDED